MENLNTQKKKPSNSIWGGLIIIAIGVIFLLGNLDINIPHWIISWHTALLLIGLAIGFRRNFNGGGWLILVVIGAVFTIDDIADLNFSFTRLTWPILLIGLGIFLILKPKGMKSCRSHRKHVPGGDLSGSGQYNTSTGEADATNGDKEDFLDSINIFGGSHQKVFSKNFQGGDVLAIFGGCDIDLTQADFDKTIVVEVTAIFGGCKIIVPPSWEIKSEVTAIFGGVDDKRKMIQDAVSPAKRIVLKGIAMFGGVDIRSY